MSNFGRDGSLDIRAFATSFKATYIAGSLVLLRCQTLATIRQPWAPFTKQR